MRGCVPSGLEAVLLTLAFSGGCHLSRLERVGSDAGSDAGADGPTTGGDAPLACGGSCTSGQTCIQDVCCPPVSYAIDVQPWFQARCSGCHSWTRETLVSTSPNRQKCGPVGAGANYSSAWRLVAAGDLADSVVWWFAQDCCAPTCGAACANLCLSPPCSSSIPKCGSDDPLCQASHRTTDAERERLKCWILEGAQNN